MKSASCSAGWQWRRRNKKEKEAWELLLQAPTDPKLLVDLDEWWIERRIHTRNALNKSYPEVAYAIARDHGPASNKHLVDAEFMAGWIALRFLKQPETALKHFEVLRGAAKGPKVIARAEYWLGRTKTELKKPGEAASHYRKGRPVSADLLRSDRVAHDRSRVAPL